MVKQEFADKAPVGFVEQETEELILGNAFVGAADKEAHDREMWNALHASSIMGDEAPNNGSIANAQLRMTAGAGKAGGRDKDGAKAAQEFYSTIVVQRLMEMQRELSEWADDLRQERQAIAEQIDHLAEFRKLLASGEYDPADPRHAALYAEAFPEATEQDKEDFDSKTTSEQLDIVDDETLSAQKKYDDLGETIDDIDAAIADIDAAMLDGRPLANDGGSFTNPILEQARVQAGISIDFDNITEENMMDICNVLSNMRVDMIDERFDAEQDNPNLENVSNTLTADTLSFDLG